MKTNKPTLLIPVEIQTRELGPKLLLACVAARRGFPKTRLFTLYGIDQI
jgi:hypothetical protein